MNALTTLPVPMDRTFPDPDGATPMMQQFLALRAEAPADALLFYRMGDFYELFFDDAVRAAAALDIALTKRGEHQGAPIPMCGVPAATAEAYLARLIKAGFKVAVGEQMEDPKAAKARGAKAVVRRDITRIVTPGTLTEDSLLDPRRSNRIAALARTGSGDAALAWAEISTGEFAVTPLEPSQIGAELAAMAPAELLIDENRYADSLDLVRGAVLTPLPRAKFDPASGERQLKSQYGVQDLEAFGQFEKCELSALGALLDYLALSQAGAPAKLAPPHQAKSGSVLSVDPATRASLEIERTLSGQRSGSLLDAIDCTVTAPGARCLAERLARPLTDAGMIERRLDAIQLFEKQEILRRDIRDRLKSAGDAERALSRLLVGRGGPRDLKALSGALIEGEALAARIDRDGLADRASLVGGYIATLSLADKTELTSLVSDLERAIADEPPLLSRDGGFVAEGWRPELDEARQMRDASRRVVASLQQTYAEASGVSSLKVKHNNVLGYFVEVTAKNADALMGSEDFIHRQTMANAVRFTTTELAELEAKIASAGERALAMELEVFNALRDRVEALAEPVRLAARALAEIDVATALAEWASDRQAVRPQIETGTIFEVTGGRHPVVEQALARDGDGRFTPNDCLLDGEGAEASRLMLVTGPNMAGKSTYLRQNALMIILAQAGCYVPAERARIGLADRLYSRVGAADDLARGRSTFMAEMIETAAILNQATEKSFVILDEIGRGTATFDGLSIAWAAAEHLHGVNACRALFATHYHELTRLAEDLEAAGNSSLKAREWQGELVFLHEVGPGAADRSYGIEVARRAGLPKAAVKRAQVILDRLESEGAPADALQDLPLFAVFEPEPDVAPSRVEEKLADVDPDALSPREALDLIYALKSLAQDA
ncbi:MAG: DNA mismatch repair protein MutS [Alphaproteobacteria bacterium]|nr:DNA mismatch repair protein MutS [Alphaproteobacteria bacterium]